jgi:hypothetical protein
MRTRPAFSSPVLFFLGCLLAVAPARDVWGSDGAGTEQSAWPDQVTFPRACDGSAAVSIPAGILVATDEANTLSLFTRAGEFLGHGDFVAPIEATGQVLDRKNGRVREIDVEGAAAGPDRIYWIASHGLSSKGKPRENRQMLFATRHPTPAANGRFEIELLGSPVSLKESLLALPGGQGAEIRRLLDERVPPKQGGLNIEGMGLAPDGSLLIGLRSPLFGAPDRGGSQALLVRLKDPSRALADGRPQVTGALVRLGNRGVRGLGWSSSRSAWILLAGPVDASADFALFSWRGEGTAAELLVGGLRANPEAVIVEAEGVFLLSDDGTEMAEVAGIPGECKDHLDAHAERQALKEFSARAPAPSALSFRGYWVPWPEE